MRTVAANDSAREAYMSAVSRHAVQLADAERKRAAAKAATPQARGYDISKIRVVDTGTRAKE